MKMMGRLVGRAMCWCFDCRHPLGEMAMRKRSQRAKEKREWKREVPGVSKNFEVVLTIPVRDVDQEAEEFLRDDPLDFIEANDLLDEALISIREMR